MSARPLIATTTVAVAAPDAAAILRQRRLDAAATRSMTGTGGGVIGHDRGSPELSYTGPVPAAVQPRHGRIIAAPADVPYMPPAYQDAAGVATPELTGLAAIQYARMTYR
jgi:hypothetical protein